MAKKKLKFDTSSEPIGVVRDLGNRKKLTPHDVCSIRPQSNNQQKFIDAYLSDAPLISVTGPAGCGKTFLAMGMALLDVLDDSTAYDKVVMIRSAVETRKQGFLPGDQSDKDAPYETPYVQVCHALFPRLNDGYAHLKTLGHLSFHTTGHFRGQNLDRSIILIDESENLDWGELYTLISRTGRDTRIILMGDHKQNDLYRYRETSGLPRLQNVMRNMPQKMIATVEFGFDDIVRSELTKSFIIADYNTD
jgi:predicted ribonuclease YlaK